MSWHRLTETPEGDDECEVCDVVILDRAAQTFTLLCPQPPCTSPANPDDGCVFTPGRGEVCHCLYCGRPGSERATRKGVAATPDE